MSKKRENKRLREQLSSSEMDDFACDLKTIQQSITAIEQQLTKLTLLEKLQCDVEDLKQSVQYHIALVDVLKEENASLRAEVNRLNNISTELKQNSLTNANNILDLQCRSMRDNIIIHGLAEDQIETYNSTEQKVKTFLKTHLKMQDRDMVNIHFDRVHRIGQKRAGSLKHRPIVAKVTNFKSKIAIMERSRELKGTNLSVTDQFPPEILRRRRILQPLYITYTIRSLSLLPSIF